jgi:putative ABC transport system ATP-binding protein
MAMFDQLVNEGHTIVIVTHDLTVGKRAKKMIKIMDGKVAI